jgi:hypothetical protein
MTHPSSCHRWRTIRHHHTGWTAVLLGFAVFAMSWILYTPYREFYVPKIDDIPALADGSLLAPGAHWTDWFTRGYSNFWDAYPEWPLGNMGFTRPGFQFVIYLAHFALGRNWELYQIISCFAAAGMAVVAFLIAHTALGLRTGLSLLAAALVVLSPPVLECWLIGVANAHEPLTTILVAGAFFAAVARRDCLCLMLLFVALLTKENAVWAPAAAAITIVLRPKRDEPLHRRAIAAAAMFLPIVLWLGLRFTFFGGIGGTYATALYTPLSTFLNLSFKKLKYLDTLFVWQYPFVGSVSADGHSALLDRVTRIGTRLLIYALLCLWTLRALPEAMNHLRTVYEKRWPTVDATFLVTLWAGIAIVFHFALAVSDARYATSVAVFAWPAVVAEIDRRPNTLFRLGLALCCIVSVTRAWYYSIEFLTEFRGTEYRSIEAALNQTPKTIRQVYIVVSNDSLPVTNPDSLRIVLDVSAEIVRVIDIHWDCAESKDLVAFNHNIVNGVVNLTVTLPSCANFAFWAPVKSDSFANGHLYRSATISYELPEAYITTPNWPFELGRKMTVHVRPKGAARFIIEHGTASGIAWFDTP